MLCIINLYSCFYVDMDKLNEINELVRNIVDKYFSNIVGGVGLGILILIAFFFLFSNVSKK